MSGRMESPKHDCINQRRGQLIETQPSTETVAGHNASASAAGIVQSRIALWPCGQGCHWLKMSKRSLVTLKLLLCSSRLQVQSRAQSVGTSGALSAQSGQNI